MKYLITLFIAAFIFVSCREENTPVLPLDEMAAVNGVIQNTGVVTDGNRRKASGKVSIVTDGTASQLVFENLMVENAPDLHVYLSNEIDPKEFINLGLLRSIKGNQVYDVPVNVNAENYKYALIYCVRFSHLYGVAELR